MRIIKKYIKIPVSSVNEYKCVKTYVTEKNKIQFENIC